jgi:hypothetical protein
MLFILRTTRSAQPVAETHSFLMLQMLVYKVTTAS